MKHFYLFFFLCVLALVHQPAQAQWASILGSEYSTTVVSSTLDASGNSYVTGYYSGTLRLNGTSILTRSTTSQQMFVARFSPQGNLLWAQSATDGGRSYGYAIAVDANGIVTVSGEFQEDIRVGGTAGITISSTNANDSEGFVARYSAQGGILAAWAVRGSGGRYTCSNLVVDGSANSYVTGERVATTLTGTIRNLFVRKYDNQGQLLWSKDVNGTTLDKLQIALLGANVLISGGFSGTATFSSQKTLTNGGIYSAFYDGQTGNFISATLLTNTGYPNALRVDATGSNFYLVGDYRSNLVFGGTLPLATGNAGTCGFLAKFNAQGVVQWARAITSTGGRYPEVSASCLVLSATGTHLTVGGRFSGTITVGSTNLTGGDTYYGLLANYSTEGILRGVRKEGGPGASTVITTLTSDPTGGTQPAFFGYLNPIIQTQASSVVIAGVTLSIPAFGGISFLARGTALALATQPAKVPAQLFTVYPIPARDGHVSVVLPAATSAATLTIYSSLGQLLFSQSLPARTTTATISTASLPTGQYLMRITDGATTGTQLLQVE